MARCCGAKPSLWSYIGSQASMPAVATSSLGEADDTHTLWLNLVLALRLEKQQMLHLAAAQKTCTTTLLADSKKKT